MSDYDYIDEDPLEQDIEELGEDSPVSTHVCAKCGCEYYYDLDTCPNCGLGVSTKSSIALWIIIAAVAVLLGFFLLIMLTMA